MKKLLITYHMRNAKEGAETCAVLPMTDDLADEVLTWGDDSRLVRAGGIVWRVLSDLAQMQGYYLSCFVCAEEVKGGV